jgi:thiazole/oxazole-forming peptide maturase SagD family component
MNGRSFMPIYSTPGIRDEKGWKFRVPRMGSIRVRNYASEIAALLDLAQGHETAPSIVERMRRLGYDPVLAKELIKNLTSLGVLRDSATLSSDAKALAALMGQLGPGKPVEWVRLKPTTPDLDFYQAVARWGVLEPVFSKADNRLAGGIARSTDMASIKAIAEAFERYVFGRVRVDAQAPAAKLTEPWLEPGAIAPLTDKQYAKLPYLDKFDIHKPLQWVRGLRYDGSSILVPVDLVFSQPKSGNRKPIVGANSSGMAAHVTVKEAARLGLLELIERDALMRVWFSKQPPRRIALSALPPHQQNRAEYWQQRGKKFEVLDLSHDGIAIALVVVRSADGGYPYMASGAAASTESFVAAVDKARQEAEAAFAFEYLRESKPKAILPEQIKSADDHGMLYCYNTYASEVEWLWSREPTRRLPRVTPGRDIEKLYKPITVRLTTDDDFLQVVRVLCPRLVPIAFGFGNEYISHPALGGVRVRESSVPHFFA